MFWTPNKRGFTVYKIWWGITDLDFTNNCTQKIHVSSTWINIHIYISLDITNSKISQIHKTSPKVVSECYHLNKIFGPPSWRNWYFYLSHCQWWNISLDTQHPVSNLWHRKLDSWNVLLSNSFIFLEIPHSCMKTWQVSQVQRLQSSNNLPRKFKTWNILIIHILSIPDTPSPPAHPLQKINTLKRLHSIILKHFKSSHFPLKEVLLKISSKHCNGSAQIPSPIRDGGHIVVLDIPDTPAGHQDILVLWLAQHHVYHQLVALVP